MSLHGSEIFSCGGEHSPCRSVKHAVEKSHEHDVIHIDGWFWGRPAEYKETNIIISKAIKLTGHPGKPILRYEGRGTFLTVMNSSAFQVQDVRLEVKDTHALIISIHDASTTVAKSDFQGGNISLLANCEINCQLKVEGCNFVGMVTGIQILGGYSTFSVLVNNTDFSGIQRSSRQAITLAKESHQSEEVSGTIEVTKSTFQNFASAFNVKMTTGGKMTFNIDNCTFSNNGKKHIELGPAISISIQREESLDVAIVSITKSYFLGNSGQYGGAIYIYSWAPLLMKISHCLFEANTAYISGGAIYAFVQNLTSISESHFIKNTCMLPEVGLSFEKGGYGGAIALSGHKDATYTTMVTKCHFIENTASAMGGTIYSSLRSSSIKFVDVVFVGCDELQNRAADGDIVFLLSRVTLQNTTVTMKNPVSERNVFYIHNDDILIDKNSRFICAKGYQTAITGIESFLPPSGHFSLFSMLCRACEYNHYSVVESSFHDLKPQNPQCFPCPPGSTCLCGISKPKDYYWGYQANKSSSINYIQLPMGYGCSGDGCKHFNSCAAYREDVMCAKCLKGYSEHVLTQGCISNKHCNRSALWLLAVAFVVTYILLFLCKTEIYSLCTQNMKCLWCRTSKRRTSGAEMTLYEDGEMMFDEDVYLRVRGNTVDDNTKDDERNMEVSPTARGVRPSVFGTGLLKIAFYFYQIEILVHEDIGNHDDIILMKFLQLTRSFFNFNFLVTYDSNLCAFTNTTPVMKATFRITLIALVFLGLGIIIITARSLEMLNTQKISMFLRALGDKALSTSFEIFVLVYGVIVMTGLKLLNCVDYKGEKRLWIQGNIKCYTNWQYVILSVLILGALPFCILLFLLPKMLLRKEISKSGILFGCLFPLPFLLRKLYRVTFSKPFDGISRKSHDPVLQKILESLTTPFKKPANGRGFLWWEGVYIFRRLLLISLIRFIHDDVVKNQLMLFAQVIFLLHHIHCKPFKRRFLNHLETASLTILVVFTSISSSYAYDYKYGTSEEEDSILLMVFAWFRVVIVVTLPAVAIAVLVIPLILWFVKTVINLTITLVSYIKPKRVERISD